MSIAQFGTAFIIFLFGVFPWIALYVAHRKTRFPLMAEGGDVRRMAEGIQNVISQLTEVCHQINSHKGKPGVPVNNCYELFNPIQDQIQRPIMNQLKSLLPDGD